MIISSSCYQRAATLLFTTMMVFIPVNAVAISGSITTSTVQLHGQVDHLALNEDGSLLLAAQQQKDQFHLLETGSGKVVKTVNCPSASFIIVRGTKAYVLNRGMGTVSVFRIDHGDCVQVDQLLAGSKTVSYLSAPQGIYFKGALLATASQDHKSAVYLLREGNDQPLQLREGSSITCAVWSADGTYVVEQRSTHLNAKPAREYLDLRPTPKYEDIMSMSPSQRIARSERLAADNRWASSNATVSAPVLSYFDNDVWYNTATVLAGRPPQPVPTENVRTVIADQTASELYLLTDTRLEAVKAEQSLQHVGSFTSTLLQDMQRAIPAGRYRGNNEQLFNSPVAASVEGKTFIYAPLPAGGVLRAEMEPIGDRARLIASRTSGNSLAIAGADNFPDAVEEREPLDFPLFLQPVQGSFSVIEGPSNIEVSTTGVLSWTPTHEQLGPQQIKIRAQLGDSTSFMRLRTEVVDRQLVQSVKSLIEGTQGFHLVDGRDCHLVPNSNGETVLLLDSSTLRLLDANGKTTLGKFKLGASYTRIAERGSYFLALGPKSVDQLDRNTGKLIATVPLPPGKPTDLVCDLTQPISYVSLQLKDQGSSSTSSSVAVVRVDEQKRAATRLEGIAGEHLLLTRDGTSLFATVPGPDATWAAQFAVRTECENSIAALARYEVTGDKLQPRELICNIGGRIGVLRASMDGKEVSPVSPEGFPGSEPYSIPTLSVHQLKSRPMSYTVGPYPQDVAYHGKLPFVAATNGERILMFNRLTGRALNDVLDLQSVASIKIDKLLFSPTGKHLLVQGVVVQSQKSVVISVPLRLSDRELAQLEKSGPGEAGIKISVGSVEPAPSQAAASGIQFSETKPGSAPVAAPVSTPRSAAEVDVRRSVDGESATARISMTFEEGGAAKSADGGLRAVLNSSSARTLADAETLARQFSNSIVTIESGGSSGTGFFITANGYVLTCSHVLPEDGVIAVRYKTNGKPGEEKVERMNAKLIQRDRDDDLALLQIQPATRVTPVRLDLAAKPAMGEAVTIIGNPGLGSTILEQTMTQGIVSYQNRMIDGKNYIQTSAAVNPGSSGSPAFNKYGQVVGVVVAKASVAEGVGFIVSPSRVMQFIKSCLK